MLEVLEDTIIDSIKLIPFLFVTYLIMEFIEHKASEKTEELIRKSGKFGPVLGAFLGVVPQCGFSAVAANFYAAKIITRGTLIAIFLSTSDEMLPILISEGADIWTIVQILLIKVVIGMGLGLTIDLLQKNNRKMHDTNIHQICEEEQCHCEEEGIVKSSIKHTIQIFAYILVISLILNIIIHFVGEERIANLIVNIPILGTLISALIGIIPNCASSIILTELYLEQIITVGQMIAGLLVNSGIGILVLFKVNKDYKDNFKILGILYLIGITSGFILDLLL
mgnify:FL=1